MKSILSILMLMMALTSFGQGKYGANPEDSLTCIQNLSVYSEYYKQKAFDNALPAWRKAVEICPKSSKNLYLRGATMYATKISREKDPKRKKELLDTLMIIYDLRIEHFGQKGYVLGRKGSDLAKFGKDPKAAYEILNESFQLRGNKTEAGALVYLYKTKLQLLKAGKTTKEEAIALFPELMAVVEANKAAGKEKLIKKYSVAEGNLQSMFEPIASCDDLIKLFTPKFEANPNDPALLKNIIGLMQSKECTKADLYIKSAVKLNEIEPSDKSAYAIGTWYLKKGSYAESVPYFVQSADLTEDNARKEESYLRAAAASLGSKNYPAVRQYARKAIALNANNGEAYILIGDAYMGSSRSIGENECDKAAGYWAAYDKYAYAKSVDSSVASKAGKKMGQAQAQFPKKQDCFFHNIQEGSTFTVGGWIGESTKVRVNN